MLHWDLPNNENIGTAIYWEADSVCINCPKHRSLVLKNKKLKDMKTLSPSLSTHQVPCLTLCLRMLDVRDVYGDVKTHFVDPIPKPSLASETHTHTHLSWVGGLWAHQ